MKFKRIALILALILCIAPITSCNHDSTVKIIDNVSQRKINKVEHVKEWLQQDRSGAYEGITNHILEYSTKNDTDANLMGESRYTYRIIVLRENVEKKADVSVEFVETEKDITVKIIFTDKKAPAKDGRTVTYVEFKVPFNKMVYYDIVCDGDSRELLERTDKNIGM